LKQRYGDRVEFVNVYVREAHPVDGWRMSSNDKDGVAFAQPTTDAERREVAGKCCAALDMTIPLVVDHVDDRVGHAYSGMPDRLYLIDADGKVAYKGGRGPFGFKPGELEQQIAMMLVDKKTGTTVAGRFPVLTNEAAWARLPAAENGANSPLPEWARVTASTLPRTTATILELHDLHRTKNPLDPKLRAMVRWVVADANRCKYAQEVAVADLKRAGGTAEEVAALRGDRSPLSLETRRTLDVARELTRAAYKMSDDQMAALRKDLGEPKLVAFVQLVAFGNFQDRLLLSLGVAPEAGGSLAPSGVRFKRPWVGGDAPARPPLAKGGDGPPEKVADPDWRAIDFPSIQKLMEGQRGREPRVSVPDPDVVLKNLPPGAKRPRIKWSLVCFGHSPELAAPWSMGLRTFAEESKQDRVFEESLFWVVTRELQCFY
jgi:alkylhydroperoxidase family enzyme